MTKMIDNQERMAFEKWAETIACLTLERIPQVNDAYRILDTELAWGAWQAALAMRQDKSFLSKPTDLRLKIFNPDRDIVPISIHNKAGKKLNLKFDKDQTLIMEGDLPVSEAAQIFFDKLKRIATRQGGEVGENGLKCCPFSREDVDCIERMRQGYGIGERAENLLSRLRDYILIEVEGE